MTVNTIYCVHTNHVLPNKQRVKLTNDCIFKRANELNRTYILTSALLGILAQLEDLRISHRLKIYTEIKHERSTFLIHLHFHSTVHYRRMSRLPNVCISLLANNDKINREHFFKLTWFKRVSLVIIHWREI